MTTQQHWRVCSSCKAHIGFEQTYWACNVSTCNRKRLGLFFCSVSCWEAHLPSMRHRESWAVEKQSPSTAAWQREQAAETERVAAKPAPRPHSHDAPRRRVESSPSSAPAPSSASAASTELSNDDLPYDILLVVSKLKKYIRARSGMNTSEGVASALSDHVRALCDQAIRTAAQAERRTVMDRDFPPVR